MELELIRILADWFADPVYGINALLAGVQRDAGDVEPPAITLYDETRDDSAAGDRISAEGSGLSFPAVFIAIDGWLEADGEIGQVHRKGKVDVALQYATNAAGPAVAKSSGMYTLRAAERSLAYLLNNANAASRDRNGMQLQSCTKVRQGPVRTERDGARIGSALIFAIEFRDTLPGGAALPITAVINLLREVTAFQASASVVFAAGVAATTRESATIGAAQRFAASGQAREVIAASATAAQRFLASADAQPRMAAVIGASAIHVASVAASPSMSAAITSPYPLLLNHTPGDATGTRTRTTPGTYIDNAGVLQTAAINTLRDGHYIGGVRSTLLEGAATNQAVQSSNFASGSWTKSSSAVTSGFTDPSGGASAYRLLTSTTTGYLEQNVTAIAAGTQATFFLWVKSNTGATQSAILGRSSATATITITTAWQRFTVTGTPGTNYYLQANGAILDVLVAFAQVELGAFATSYIATTTAAVSRGVDTFVSTVTIPTGLITVYAKFTELGTIATSLGGVIGIGSGTNPSAKLYNSGNYTWRWDSVAGTRAVFEAANPAIGDLVELLGVINLDGSVSITQVINGGTPAVVSSATTQVLASAWSTTQVYIGAVGGSQQGFAAFQSVKIATGVRTLAELRSL